MVDKRTSKKAFSMAETLLVLTLIGVISALTIPNFVADSRRAAHAVACKKAYNVLSKATDYVYSQKEYKKGDMKDENTGEFFNYLKQAIPMSKVCENQSGCWTPNVKNLNGTAATGFNGDKGFGTPSRSFISNDGIAYTFDIQPDVNNQYYMFFADVNGIDKGPNTFGEDIFGFVDYLDGKGLIPMGSDTDRVYKNQSCSKANTGVACAAKVIKEGKITW